MQIYEGKKLTMEGHIYRPGYYFIKTYSLDTKSKNYSDIY